MLVLDEQLLGRDLENELARWYRGPVRFITDLRPTTVIKDDAIPLLLREQNSPTFVTINDSDFWRKVEIDRHFCVVCFPLPDSQAHLISERLRAVFRYRLFSTKTGRMGEVLRITQNAVSYYTYRDKQVHMISL